MLKRWQATLAPDRPPVSARAGRGRRRITGLGPGLVWALLLSLLGIAPPVSAQIQAFGKNKVQYSDFRWQVLESAHFHLYYYEEEAVLAAEALSLAERSYSVLRTRFVEEVPRPIPLIVYSSHQDFEQTNVTPIFLPEGIAGMTEYAKGRVLIPFDGSLYNFRVTIQHELVHVFQLAATDRVYKERFRNTQAIPPLWFTEGLAVHWSESRDTEADMVLRDLVLAGKLPGISDFVRYEGSYTTYKLGQSVLDYLGATYGEDRIREVYQRLPACNRFEDVLRDVFGLSQEELSQRWVHSLRRRYYPDVEKAAPADFLSRPLTQSDGADFKPLPLPRGLRGYDHHFAFLSPRNGYTNIYTASSRVQTSETRREREEELKTLVAGERRPEFESFHAFRSRMDVSADGTLLFVSKHFGRDEIVLYSILEEKVVERRAFPDLIGLSSPAWVQGTESYVFSALSREGQSDLYLFERGQGHLRRLTSDRYQDLDPTYCSWCDAIVWSSDRAPRGDAGARNLFLLELGSGEIRPLTRGEWRDFTPWADPERRQIFFISDRDGLYNVCSVDERGRGRPWTQCLEPTFDPRPVPGEGRFLAAVYRNGGFQVRSFPLPDSSAASFALAATDSARTWTWPDQAAGPAPRSASYRSHFSLDAAQGGVLLDPGMRSGEGMLAAFSDMMGNHLIYVGLGNTTFTAGDILRNLSIDMAYVNLSHRLNYGLSLYHYAGDYFDELGDPYFERRVGGGILLRYPLNKYERLETDLNLAYAETDHPSLNFRRTGPVGTHSISYIRDTSLWLPTGPIDGQRLNVTAGTSVNLRRGVSENTLLAADWRRYVRLGLLSAYAVRLQGRWSEGPNPEIFLLGGSYSLRGWPRRSFYGKRSLLVNQEIRFPLVRALLLGLPVGDLELPGIQGALFADAGSAWNYGWPPPWQGSYGFGFRMGFGGYLVFRLDFGWRADRFSWGDGTQTEFSIGWDF